MSQGNIKVLLVLAAIAILGLTYLYAYKPNSDDKKTIESEIETLQKEYDDLKAQEAHRDEYLAEIEENYAKFEERLAYFPATLDQEISVMFIKGVEKDKGNLQFGVNSVGLGAPELFYTIGSAPNVASDTVATQGGEVISEAGAYQCAKASFPINYEGSYEGLKDFIDYIMAYKYRMNISAFNIAYDSSSDSYSGSISLNAYCVAGGDREADKVDVNVEEGVYNPFLGGNGAANVSSSSHDTDEGASIESSHDIEIALNNANGDSTDGIMVSAGASDSYVTSTENSLVDVKVEIAEEDGKNMVTYSIGDSSYSFELTGDELAIFVESSKRVDSDDKNGVKVSVENSTDIPVYFKVSGDDSASPRFAVGSKTGTVKVY